MRSISESSCTLSPSNEGRCESIWSCLLLCFLGLPFSFGFAFFVFRAIQSKESFTKDLLIKQSDAEVQAIFQFPPQLTLILCSVLWSIPICLLQKAIAEQHWDAFPLPRLHLFYAAFPLWSKQTCCTSKFVIGSNEVRITYTCYTQRSFLDPHLGNPERRACKQPQSRHDPPVPADSWRQGCAVCHWPSARASSIEKGPRENRSTRRPQPLVKWGGTWCTSMTPSMPLNWGTLFDGKGNEKTPFFLARVRILAIIWQAFFLWISCLCVISIIRTETGYLPVKLIFKILLKRNFA